MTLKQKHIEFKKAVKEYKDIKTFIAKNPKNVTKEDMKRFIQIYNKHFDNFGNDFIQAIKE